MLVLCSVVGKVGIVGKWVLRNYGPGDVVEGIIPVALVAVT